MMKRFLYAVIALGLAALAVHAGFITQSGPRAFQAVSGSSSSDFTTRCAASGVLKCVSFDTDTDFNQGAGGTQGAWGAAYGLLPPSGTNDYTKATRDSTTFASGTSSLRFTIPANAGSDVAGAWFTNFKDDLSVQIGEGEDIYVQWRQRFSPGYLTTMYQAAGGGLAGGWKIADISAGDKPTCALANAYSAVCPTACWDFEIITQNTNLHGLPQMYTNCAGPYPYMGLQGLTSNVTVQNNVDCLYPTYAAPPCIVFHPNEWMTFTEHVHVGTWNTWSSTIQLWVAREGEASTLVIDCSPTTTHTCHNFINNAAATGWYLDNSDTSYKIGKIWLTPYHTSRSTSYTYTTEYTWYDDLIISTSPISDPSSGSTGGTVATLSAPTPSGTLATSTTATLGATSDQSLGTFYAVADTSGNLSGVTVAQVKAGQKASGSAALKSCNAAVSSSTPSCGITGLSSSTAYAYALEQTNPTGDSNLVTGTFTTGTATPATLSLPTPSGTLVTSTSATPGATTNQASGTLYAVVDTSGNLSGVTAPEIKLGQRASGANAVSSCNSSVSSTTPSCTTSGLSASTAYAYAEVQNNTNGDSNITSGTFTTAALGAGRNASSALAVAGAGMAVGQWKTLTMSNVFNALGDSGQSTQGSIVYSPRMNYASTGKVFHYGGIHANCPVSGHGNVVGVYDIDTNSWTTELLAESSGICLTHSYDMAATDASGRLWYMRYGNADLSRRNTNGTYTVPVKTLSNFYSYAGGVAFHPNYGTSGSIIRGDGLYLQAYNVATGVSTMLYTTGSYIMGDGGNSAVYVPAHDKVYVGGGCSGGVNVTFSVAASGAYATIPTPPVEPMACSAANGAAHYLAATTTSGLLLLDIVSNNIYEFNGTSWSGDLGNFDAGFLSQLDSDKIVARTTVPASETGLGYDLIMWIYTNTTLGHQPSTTAYLWRYN